MSVLASLLRVLGPGTTPFGLVSPARPPPRPLPVDGRTIALLQLREYITNLDLLVSTGPGKPPERFNILPENFHIEWPDGEEDLKFPAVTILPAAADYEELSFPPFLLEDTKDVYGRGTAVQVACAWQETLKMEIHATRSAQRQGIKAAIETQMNPLEELGGLRLAMPGYFGETCRFTMTTGEVVDGPDSAKARRKCQLGLLLEHNVVRLVDYVTLRPAVTMDVGLTVQVDQRNPFRP